MCRRRPPGRTQALLAPEIQAALRDRVEHGSAQPPDLLMYAPDLSDWCFCEVKGPADALRPQQVRKFDALATMTGRPVPAPAPPMDAAPHGCGSQSGAW